MTKLAFIYTNKSYSVYHSLSLAIELSKIKNFDIHILCTKRNEKIVTDLLNQYDCKAVNVMVLRPFWFINLPRYLELKLQLLPSLVYKYRKLLKTFDGFVCTVYDDLYIKQVLSKEGTKYIFSNHGVSNRAYSFDERIINFDLFFLLDKKEVKIRSELKQLTSTNHVLTGLVKYDLVKRLTIEKLFGNTKPTVLYNPHWDKKLSSFFKFGEQILEAFSKTDKYNLIFAPHSLLLSRNWKYFSVFQKYRKFNNIIVDYKSEHCNNMGYTRYADIYLGDISSQAFEFLYERPKPCLYIDAHNLANSKKDRPISWDLGDVIESSINIVEAIDKAVSEHYENYHEIQQRTINDMFNISDDSATEIGSRAIQKLMIEK